MTPLDPANPGSWNNFDIAKPMQATPFKAPAVHAPKLVPDERTLYQIQRDALQVVNDLKAIEDQSGKEVHGLANAIRHAEHTYRSIRRYLSENVNPQQGGLG